MALRPLIGQFAKEQIDNGLSAAGAIASDSAILSALTSDGVNYLGFTMLKNGTIIIAIILAAITAFVIDRKILHAAFTSLAASLLSAIGRSILHNCPCLPI